MNSKGKHRPFLEGGEKSTLNSTTTLLASGATYTGTGELNNYSHIGVYMRSDVGGTLYFDWSENGSDWYSFPTAGYSVTASIPEFHTAVKLAGRYVRVRFVMDAGTQTEFFLLTSFGYNLVPSVAPLNQSISSDQDAIVTRSVIVGQTDGGKYINTPVSSEGHLEVAIHDPLLPFGSIHTESLTPVFQTDAVYGINTQQINAVTGHATDGTTSATNTGTGSLFKCSTGTTALSFATMQSRKRLRYRPGQGVIGRFTALFSEPAASSILVAGFGSGESGYYFGYNGTTFGILHSTDGVREIQTLTITTASTATNDIQITLPSAAGTRVFTCTGITNSGSTTKTAVEIANNTFEGWSAEARGATVVFLRNSVGALTGTPAIAQSGAGTPAAGSYAETLSGVASTDTWIAQSSWNGDVCDGTGASGFTLDHQTGNVFQINIAWLGFGPVSFKILVPNAEGNNASWVTVHTINNPNSRTTPHTSQPSFPFTMAAYSAGSTTDVSVSCSSFAGFTEGKEKLTGPRASFSDISQAVSTSAYYTLFTIRNDYIHGQAGTTERANQSVVNILSFGGAHDDATPVTFYLLKNATLAGTPNWTAWSASSCIYTDTAATTATITNNEQIVQVIPVGQTGTILVPPEDDITLQPGETLTVAATTVTGTSTYTIATLNTREDQ